MGKVQAKVRAAMGAPTRRRALTPFAKAYFKLWSARAGMGEMDDVERTRQAWVDGEVSDAELYANAPPSWRRLLPPVDASSSRAPRATLPTWATMLSARDWQNIRRTADMLDQAEDEGEDVSSETLVTSAGYVEVDRYGVTAHRQTIPRGDWPGGRE